MASNKALVLGAATVGGVMIYSGIAGVSVMDVLAGKASLKDLDPKGGKGLPSLSELIGTMRGGKADTLVPPGQLLGSGSVAGKSPKQIIDSMVVPLAQKHGMATGNSPGAVDAANARHGPTVSGGRSDHQGPPDQAWAADMSNGQNPTPQMDALAKDLAKLFRINYRPGISNATWGGFRYQLIYRCNPCGGNHMNHVHFGVRRA